MNKITLTTALVWFALQVGFSQSNFSFDNLLWLSYSKMQETDVFLYEKGFVQVENGNKNFYTKNAMKFYRLDYGSNFDMVGKDKLFNNVQFVTSRKKGFESRRNFLINNGFEWSENCGCYQYFVTGWVYEMTTSQELFGSTMNYRIHLSVESTKK